MKPKLVKLNEEDEVRLNDLSGSTKASGSILMRAGLIRLLESTPAQIERCVAKAMAEAVPAGRPKKLE